MALYSYTKSKITKKLNKEDKTQRLLVRILATVFSFFIFLSSSLLLNYRQQKPATPVSTLSNTIQTISLTPTKVLAQKSEGTILGKSMRQGNNEIISLTSTPLVSPTPTSSISKPFSSKSLYTVAIIGDSMVDTMGEVMEYLDAEMEKKYPITKFLYYNYGTGAQNVEMGLNRLGSKFSYQTRNYPPLSELKPDILIIGSFAYNPFTPHDRDKHWLTLTKLVQTAKQYTPRVYMLAEIAPLRRDFGKGPQGVNWSEDASVEHSLRVIQQLENTVGLSKTLSIPLIDTFTPSFYSELREGKHEYVNTADGIHPSVEGHKFMAKIIAEIIQAP